VAQAAIIAALYVTLTYFVNAFNLANGAIQIRLSEAMCVLPIFTPAAIPGLFIGCLISNTITGCIIWDILFGSLATLLGALGTYALRHTRFAFTFPPVLANMLVVPLVLKYAYHLSDGYLFLVVTIGIGEAISVMVLGMLLKQALWRQRQYLFPNYTEKTSSKILSDKNVTSKATERTND